MKLVLALCLLAVCVYCVTSTSPMLCPDSCDKTLCYQQDSQCSCGSYKDECDCCDVCYKCEGDDCNPDLMDVCVEGTECKPIPGNEDTPLWMASGKCQ